MRRMAKIWVGTVLTFMLASCAATPKRPESIALNDYGYTKEYITWMVKKGMKQKDVTGLSIALVDDQQVVWSEGFGFADEANEVPATSETIYRAGSISKLFNATAVMQLAEQGKLNIDKPLTTYLPEFSIKSRFPDAAPITPRNIMTHHSGLPSDLAQGMWTKYPEPFGNVVNMLWGEYVANPPNYVFSYSNLGVTILGHALERITGKDYASHMNASLLSPLGMTNSAFSQGPDSSLFASKAYQKGEEVVEAPLRDLPAGGLNTTVLDLSSFMQMVFAEGRVNEHQIIKPETLAEMLRPQNAAVPLDLDLRIGLAWGLTNSTIRNAGPVAGHGGATLYHHSMLLTLTEHKLGVVVLANSGTAGSMVGEVATEALKLALEAKTGIKQPEPAESSERDKNLLTQEMLQSYEGLYATSFGVVEIIKKSDYLQAKIGDTSLRLVPRSGGQLGVQHRMFGIIPISLGKLDQVGFSRATVAGREIVKANKNGLETLVGVPINPVPIPKEWQNRAGEYEIINDGEDAFHVEGVRLYEDNGLLLMEYSIPFFSNERVQEAIKPLSDSEAVFFGLGRNKGETIRVVKVDAEEVFHFSGYVLKRR